MEKPKKEKVIFSLHHLNGEVPLTEEEREFLRSLYIKKLRWQHLSVLMLILVSFPFVLPDWFNSLTHSWSASSTSILILFNFVLGGLCIWKNLKVSEVFRVEMEKCFAKYGFRND